MKRNIPSRICDRCGGVYKLADTSRTKGNAFKAVLKWEPPEGGDLVERVVAFPDLCPACASLLVQVLEGLNPKPPAEAEAAVEGGTP